MQNRKKIVAKVKDISSNTADKIAKAQTAINNFFTGGPSYDGFNGPEDLQKAIFRRQQLA